MIVADWNYLRALNDIDRVNQEKKEKVQSRVKWVERYVDMLHFYSSCVACDAEGGGLSCQVKLYSIIQRIHNAPDLDFSKRNIAYAMDA